jgi:branched-chain amino acid transport system substrate-binding protein
VTEAGVFLISPNAGTSTFAGKECNPNLFVTSYQNDQVHEVLGEYAQSSGMKKVIIIVPNYQAGKDAAAGTSSPAKYLTKCTYRSANSTIPPS